MKKFYVIDYIDDEGDQVVKHALLEPDEAKELWNTMVSHGIIGSMTDLSSQSTEAQNPEPETRSLVISSDEETE